MENSNAIGNNLKKIRKSQKLSRDKVAELTGVSKAMLGQIERGESNPTVLTLWKISTGLKKSFSSFMQESDSKKNIEYCLYQNSTPIIEEDGLMTAYPLFYFNSQTGIEVFTIILQPGCDHSSEPHDDGTEEYVLVTQGSMVVTVDDNIYSLPSGAAIHFPANHRHSYKNSGDDIAIFQNIIHYSI
ncbi:helix-turn-helix domain-containing protein [Anaerocolumna jejuensis]|uniref:helix-turn-helix domain-containing protein n=1 Tax=Anaerocolumna jejuensis TaxID=259063 RepID=UPI003F7CCC28